MCQKNVKTVYERPVRFCVCSLDEGDDSEEDKNEDWSCWTWLDDNNKNWIAYSPYITVELETIFQKYTLNNHNNNNNKKKTGSTCNSTNIVKIKINDTQSSKSSRSRRVETTYTVDLETMEQTNERTKHTRKVKREISDATNLKVEVKEEQAANVVGDSKSGQKRKKLEHAASTTSTISVKSEPDHDENNENQADSSSKSTGSKNKRLKKVRDQIADVKVDNEDFLEVVVKKETKPKPPVLTRTSTRSGRQVKAVKYDEDNSYEDQNEKDDSYNSKDLAVEEAEVSVDKEDDGEVEEEEEPRKKKRGAVGKKKPVESDKEDGDEAEEDEPPKKKRGASAGAKKKSTAKSSAAAKEEPEDTSNFTLYKFLYLQNILVIKFFILLQLKYASTRATCRWTRNSWKL
jgi:hypothetical protein